MKQSLANYLFEEFKTKLIDQSKKGGQEPAPIGLVFELNEGEPVCIYYNLDTYYLRGIEEVERYLEETRCFEEHIELMRTRIGFEVKEVSFKALAEDFETLAPQLGFPFFKHIVIDKTHYYVMDYQMHCKTETIADFEQYCYNSIIESIDQLSRHYFGKLWLQKNYEPSLFNEKIETLVPYWGEFGLDGLYINMPPNESDLNTGYFLRTAMSLGETACFSNMGYRKVLSVLYRVCARLKKALIDHPLLNKDFKCYPCVHDVSEDYVQECMELAEKTLNLSLEEYLAAFAEI